MVAVWSFWSKPYLASRSAWKSGPHHLMAWSLSFELARKHYPMTALYTDDEGARLLVDGLGLDFGRVSTRLNDLAGHDADLWAFGKVVTYSLQEEPFVHIDSDVFLWSRLPDHLTRAGVLAQNPEAFGAREVYYQPDLVRLAVRSAGGWVPPELSAFTPRRATPRAVCCGILGGNRVDFIRHYAEQAVRFMDEPSNRPVWASWPDRSCLSMMFEQLMLMAHLDYHRGREGSPFADVSIEYLFSDFRDGFRRAPEVGFTHLMADSKQDRPTLDRLEARMRRDDPDRYERCLRLGRATA